MLEASSADFDLRLVVTAPLQRRFQYPTVKRWRECVGFSSSSIIATA
jgi:hypothetical protein